MYSHFDWQLLLSFFLSPAVRRERVPGSRFSPLPLPELERSPLWISLHSGWFGSSPGAMARKLKGEVRCRMQWL
jgi:hypothetical protein